MNRLLRNREGRGRNRGQLEGEQLSGTCRGGQAGDTDFGAFQQRSPELSGALIYWRPLGASTSDYDVYVIDAKGLLWEFNQTSRP